MYNATTHQVRQHSVLARRTKKGLIFDDPGEWAAFCIENAERGTPERGEHMKERDFYATRYAEWVKKDTRGKKRTSKEPKRTPYRQDAGPKVRWGGSLKRPAE